MKSVFHISQCGLLLFVIGCQPSATSDKPDVEVAPAKQEAVAVASWDDVQQKVESHKGKVVVVDLWSSWCLPCIREFPNLVKLHEEHPDTVACMSVNLNYDGTADSPPESHLEDVRKFVTEQNAKFETIVCSDPDSDVYTKIDLASIPAIYVYDKSGQLRKRFDNDLAEYGNEGFTYEQHVIPLVEELLAE